MVLYAIAFDFDCPFSFKKVKLHFGGYEFVFHYGGNQNVDVIETILKDNNETEQFAQTAIDFCQRIVKANETCSFRYVIEFIIGGIKTPIDLIDKEPAIRIKRRSNNLMADVNEIGEFLSEEQKIVTSLINDAQNTKNPFFKFLCYWKILEIPVDSKYGNARKWINNILKGDQADFKFNNNILDMLEKKIDIGQYFQENYRNAIAHITRPPFLSTHNYSHFKKVSLACTDIKIFVDYYLRHVVGWYNPPIKNKIVKII
ncbi:MAG: methylamine utilization protein MauJ [Candidatus Neomarinimicrobiota bacterium]